MQGLSGVWVVGMIWGNPVGRDGLYSWHWGQNFRSLGAKGLPEEGSSACFTDGPWHVSHERPLWNPSFFLVLMSSWQSLQVVAPANLISLETSRWTEEARHDDEDDDREPLDLLRKLRQGPPHRRSLRALIDRTSGRSRRGCGRPGSPPSPCETRPAPRPCRCLRWR